MKPPTLPTKSAKLFFKSLGSSAPSYAAVGNAKCARLRGNNLSLHVKNLKFKYA